MSVDWYGMDGQRLTLPEWAALYEADNGAGRIVDRTDLPGGAWVSTVLLGIDHSFGRGGPPIIFETMVFAAQDDYTDLDCIRRCTKEEAQAAHDAAVTRWTGWTPGDPRPDDAEPSFLTQLCDALTDPMPDAMVVMYPKDGSAGQIQ